MTDMTVLQARLSEAEAALHRVLMGDNVQSVGSDGRTTTYTAANIAELRRYIRDLKSQIGTAAGPIRPFF